jgi:hypothetical protein
MTTCPTAAPAPLRCPTLEESIAATAALLPRGRAWPARHPATLSAFLAWLGGLVGIPAASAWPAGFVQMGFIAALGAVRNYLEAQLCALRFEFWCATQTQTRDLWMAEYGLPDDCDPYPDLCAKVAALGGRRCELYQELCAANGWIIDCVAVPACLGTAYPPAIGVAFQANAFQTDAFQQPPLGQPTGPNAALAGIGCAGNILAGGAAAANLIEIVVFTSESPAFTGGAQTPAEAGRMFAGMPLTCPPDIGPLQCLIERIVPAHVVVTYQIKD